MKCRPDREILRKYFHSTEIVLPKIIPFDHVAFENPLALRALEEESDIPCNHELNSVLHEFGVSDAQGNFQYLLYKLSDRQNFLAYGEKAIEEYTKEWKRLQKLKKELEEGISKMTTKGNMTYKIQFASHNALLTEAISKGLDEIDEFNKKIEHGPNLNVQKGPKVSKLKTYRDYQALKFVSYVEENYKISKAGCYELTLRFFGKTPYPYKNIGDSDSLGRRLSRFVNNLPDVYKNIEETEQFILSLASYIQNILCGTRFPEKIEPIYYNKFFSFDYSY
ncbi:MAG: hypothetical protein RIG62_00465 [Cyclobacteriaceae bacterium]